MLPGTLQQLATTDAPSFRSAHLVGIGGSGMTSLAEILHGLGVRVTGSDASCHSTEDRRLPSLGIETANGHSAELLPGDVETLIYSPAIGADNPERQRASQRGIPQLSLPECLAALMRTRVGICIAGTHGKSTTTAIAAWILQSAGMSPTAYIGAALQRVNRGGWAGRGELFVVESCEYRRNFLQFEPSHAVILGVEPDHFETYPDEAALLEAFADFAGRMKPGGTLTVNGDCPRSLRAAAQSGVPFDTLGVGADTDWQIRAIESSPAGQNFRLQYQDGVACEIEFPLHGDHNIDNAAAAAVVCLRMGVSPADVQNAVREFPGVQRRFEIVGDWRGITVIDDYAHHPTAVRVTLETAKSVFADRRVWCVFQPHQTARVRRMRAEFAAALAIADRILIAPAFSAREFDEVAARTCARELAETMTASGGSCRFISSLDRILPSLEDEAGPGDVAVLMGAGDIERIRHELSRRISRDHSHQ